MPSKPETLEKLTATLAQIPLSRHRKMFGEVGVYFNDKMVASLCDDRFFLKPTSAVDGSGYEVAPPYPGAKDQWVIPDAEWMDPETLGDLLDATAKVTPAPKPKKKA